MRITKTQLKRIIREEYSSIQGEGRHRLRPGSRSRNSPNRLRAMNQRREMRSKAIEAKKREEAEARRKWEAEGEDPMLDLATTELEAEEAEEARLQREYRQRFIRRNKMKLSKRQLKRIIREEYNRLKRRGLIRENADPLAARIDRADEYELDLEGALGNDLRLGIISIEDIRSSKLIQKDMKAALEGWVQQDGGDDEAGWWDHDDIDEPTINYNIDDDIEQYGWDEDEPLY